jgi:hypothetical protein
MTRLVGEIWEARLTCGIACGFAIAEIKRGYWLGGAEAIMLGAIYIGLEIWLGRRARRR